MDTERVLRATLLQLTQEDDLAVDLLYRDVVVLDALEALLHLVQLMVMRGEERARLSLGMLVQVFDDGPRNGDAIVGTRATAQLVEEYQRVRRDIVQNVRCFGHLNHEGRLAERDIVRRTDAGEYLVYQPYLGPLGRHVVARLCHQGDERRLSQQCRLTRHVRTRNDDDLLFVTVKQHVVRHVALAHGQLCLDHGVASLADVQPVVGSDDGPHVVVLLGRLGSRQQTVEASNDVGVLLHLRYELLGCLDELVEQLLLQRQDAVLGAKYLLLILLQLLRDVTLGLGQRLLAHPLLRHLVFIRVAHLEVVAEDVVVAYLQRRNARLLSLALLNLQQVVLARVGNAPQLVKFVVDAVAYDAPLLHLLWRVGSQLGHDAVAQRLAEVQLLPHPAQRCGGRRRASCLHACLTDGGYGLQCCHELHHFPWRHTSCGHLRYDTLQVADALQVLVHRLAERGVAVEVVHHVEPFVDAPLVPQGEHQPPAKHAPAHGADRAVDDVEQRLAVLLHGLQQLQRADGKLVEPDEALLLNARQRSDVGYLRVQRLFQVLQHGSGSHDAVLHVVDTEALERLHLEVAVQLLVGRLLGEHPVVQQERDEPRAEVPLEVVAPLAVVDHLLGLEVAYQLLHIVVRTLADEELARGDVEKRNATGRLAQVDGSEEIVLLVVEHRVLHGHARSHQFGDASLHQFLGQFRVLQLVADGHALARPDQFRQVGVQRVVRESRHLVALVVAVVSVGQCDAQYLSCRDGILAVGLVEVAASEQQHGLRVFRLEVEKLLHHRGKLLVCHSPSRVKSGKGTHFFVKRPHSFSFFQQFTLIVNVFVAFFEFKIQRIVKTP